MEKIILPQARDLGQTIGDPFLFVRANFKMLLKVFFYFAVPPLLVGVAFAVFGLQNIFHKGVITGATAYSNNVLEGIGAMFIMAYGVFILTLTFQQIYISEFMILKEPGQDTDISNGEVLQRIKKDWKIILTTYLVMLPLSMVGGGIFGLLFRSAAIFGAWLAGLMVFILLLFFVYSTIPLSNFLFVRLRERLSIAQSLIKCFRITSGNWWRTFGAWMVVGVIFYFLAASLLWPALIVSAVMNLHTSAPADPQASADFAKSLMGIFATFGTFILFFFMNLLNVFIGINYFSLSERYDNTRLKAEIAQIGERDSRNLHRQEGEY